MARPGTDQADGLRRMFRRPPPPVIAFAGSRSGSGATRVACAFAEELAGRGVSVTLIDEHRGDAGAAALLNARARFDLWQVINGDALITQAVVLAGPGLRILPAGRLAQQRDALDPMQRSRLEQSWRATCDGCEVVVIDALVGGGGRLSALAAQAGALVMVTGADSAAVMGAYLVLKQIVLSHPRLGLSLVINRALDAAQASAIVDNMRGLLREQLGRPVDCYGWLPRVAEWRRGAAVPTVVPDSMAGLKALFRLLPASLQYRPPVDADSSDQTLTGSSAPPSPAPTA